jgi:hypothetical protein
VTAAPQGFSTSSDPVPGLMAASAAAIAAEHAGRRRHPRLPHKEEQQEDNYDLLPWFAHGMLPTARYHNVSMDIIGQ